MTSSNLTVNIGGLRLDNPVMTASGSFGYGCPGTDLIDPSSLGALVTSPVSLRPRRGAPPPRASIRPEGFILRTGGANPGVERVLAANARRWEELSVAVIVHAEAGEPSEMADLMDRLEESRTRLERSLDFFVGQGEAYNQGRVLTDLAETLHDAGDDAAALARIAEAERLLVPEGATPHLEYLARLRQRCEAAR